MQLIIIAWGIGIIIINFSNWFQLTSAFYYVFFCSYLYIYCVIARNAFKKCVTVMSVLHYFWN